MGANKDGVTVFVNSMHLYTVKVYFLCYVFWMGQSYVQGSLRDPVLERGGVTAPWA